MGGDECALLHFAPVHTNSYGRMFVEGALRPGAVHPDVLNTLCLRLISRSLAIACKTLEPQEARHMQARCRELLQRAEPYVSMRVVKRKPRRWPHQGTGGYVSLPETKLVAADAMRAHNPLADTAPSDARLVSVFDWMETTVSSARFGTVLTRRTVRYVRVTFCGFVCPERLLLEQCERRLTNTVPLSPLVYDGDTAHYAEHLKQRATTPVVMYLIPRVDVVYNPMTALGEHSAIDQFALPPAKHGERSSGVCDVVDYASDRWDGSDTDPGGDFEHDYDLGDGVATLEDAHSDNTNGTSHTDSEDERHDVMEVVPRRENSVDTVPQEVRQYASALDAGVSSVAVQHESREERRHRKRRAMEARRERVQRKVEVVHQTFGAARRDVGLALPPSVTDVRESAENERHEIFWDKSVDARELLKHLERWMVCIAGVARSRRVVMTRLLQRIDSAQTEQPFLDMMVQAVLCLAVCEDEKLATMFINTYGDLVQCQVSGVVKMNRQREIMQRYKCIEYEARAGRKAASLWHVRVRNAVVTQVGEIVSQYNAYVRQSGGLVQESFLRSTVGATRDYFTTEAQAVRRPLSESGAAASGATRKRGQIEEISEGGGNKKR